MDVTLKINLQVSPDEKGKFYDPKDLIATAKEAIEEALNHGKNRGFNHPLAHEVSIGISSIESVEIDEKFICASENDDNDCFDLKSNNFEDAVLEALGYFGRCIRRIKNEDNDTEEG